MELLFVLLGLVGFGVFLAFGFTVFAGLFSIIGAVIIGLISYLANFIGLSIAIILVSLYVLLPLNTFLVSTLIFACILGFLCWYYSDTKSVNQ